MSGPDDALQTTVRQWIEKAENDLTVAAHSLKLRDKCPTDTVCFHAQQCIEKYHKVLLIVNLIDFPKTHDLNALARLLRKPLMSLLTDEERRRLTEYATVLRYPGDYEPITLSEARGAVRIARHVRREIRHLLPKVVLRRKRKR
jgi:HEPN domain-containing protein